MPLDPTSALRPMTMGELLDRALQLFRRNFLALFTILLVFEAPMFALKKAFDFVGYSQFPEFTRPGAFRGAMPPPEHVVALLVSLAWFLPGMFVLYQLAIASVVSFSSKAWLGEEVTPGTALRDAFRRLPQVVVTFLLVVLIIGGVVLLAALPGVAVIAAGAGLVEGRLGVVIAILGAFFLLLSVLVAMLWASLRYALVIEVVMLEGRSVGAALARSSALMAGRVGATFLDNCKFRASILYAVNFCISAAVVIPLSLPTFIVQWAYGTSPLDPENFDPTRVPLYASLPAELLQFLGQAAVVPYGLIAIVLFYFDVRIKREGFDLEYRAARVGAAK